MKTHRRRLNGEKREITHVVRLYAKDAYIKGTLWSLTMSGSTGEVHWRMCQLVWLAGTQTGLGNLHGISLHLY